MAVDYRQPIQGARRWRHLRALAATGLAWLSLGVSADPAALAQLLAQARPSAGQACKQAGDTLSRVLCLGQLRVGVRTDYPPFAQRRDDVPVGFEIDLARELAARLGVQARFVAVTPANRMAMLGEQRVDVVVATTGHTVQRDVQALFVRPHYYQSQTIIVGPRGPPLTTLAALAGKSVCVTVGNGTNAELAGQGARLMLYGDARQMIEQLRHGGCSLAAQDDSLFAHHLQQDDFGARFEMKLGFSPLRWGAAVGRDGGDRLAQALGLALQDLHADGSVLLLARRHGVATPFLAAQQRLWSAPPCHQAAALTDARCVAPAHGDALAATAFAPQVERLEAWLQQRWGVQVTLAMLKTRVALKLFLQGMGFSLALVAGAVLATLALGLGLGAGLGARQRWVRWPLRGLVLAMQSTPLILLMMFAGMLIGMLGASTPWTALVAAVGVLGLFNGSNAGQAIAEARTSLRAEGGAAGLPQAALRARAQLLAFVVNATRGSPTASVIGVPELLSAQTDIASFSSERVTTFTLLLLFYMGLVSLVVWLGHRGQQAWAAAAAETVRDA